LHSGRRQQQHGERFSDTFLAGDTIAVKDYNCTARASAMLVLVGGQIPEDAFHNYLNANQKSW